MDVHSPCLETDHNFKEKENNNTLTSSEVSELYTKSGGKVTKFSLNLYFTVHYFYPKISSFMLFLCTMIVLDCFKLQVFYVKKF